MHLEYITPNEYLRYRHVSCFCDYLYQIIIGNKNFSCSLKPIQGKSYHIDAFSKGLEGYYWAGSTYHDTQEKLGVLQNKLQLSLQESDDKACLLASLSILDWGQVYRECVNWLVELSQNDEVVPSLIEATALIDGTKSTDASNFVSNFKRGGKYRCNSGTTKIFALVSNKSIIYDGRVACALGMLVLDYVSENNLESIPKELLFLMDSDIKRNPSVNNYKFPTKSNMEHKLLNQAVSNLRINLILQNIQKKVIHSGVFSPYINSRNETLRAIESVLFMVGYKVNHDNYKTYCKYLVI